MSQLALNRRSLVRALAAGTGHAVLPWQTGSGSASTRPEFDLGRVALVPIDDRPYTWYAPPKLAGAAGSRW